jgi:hypothetical protein
MSKVFDEESKNKLIQKYNEKINKLKDELKLSKNDENKKIINDKIKILEKKIDFIIEMNKRSIEDYRRYKEDLNSIENSNNKLITDNSNSITVKNAFQTNSINGSMPSNPMIGNDKNMVLPKIMPASGSPLVMSPVSETPIPKPPQPPLLKIPINTNTNISSTKLTEVELNASATIGSSEINKIENDIDINLKDSDDILKADEIKNRLVKLTAAIKSKPYENIVGQLLLSKVNMAFNKLNQKINDIKNISNNEINIVTVLIYFVPLLILLILLIFIYYSDSEYAITTRESIQTFVNNKKDLLFLFKNIAFKKLI